MQISIREDSWLAKIAAAKLRSPQVAMVWGSTIHLYGTKTADFLNDKAWVCHELKHVQQFRQYGFAGFLLRYLVESARKGYRNNRFEREARAAEQDRGLLQLFTIR